MQFFLKTQGFNIYVQLQCFEVAGQGNFFCATVFEHEAQEATEFLKVFGGGIRIALFGIPVDAVEAIKNEMRIDLSPQTGQFEFGTAAFLALAVSIKTKCSGAQQHQQNQRE